jgi:hypothetical protein
VGDLSALQRDITRILAKVDNLEQKALGNQEPQHGEAYLGDRFILDRFLNECRSDAQTVLDNIDYQQDRDFEDARLPVKTEAPEMVEKRKPESTVSYAPTAIWLKNSLGHTFKIPLAQCRTWEVRRPLASRYRVVGIFNVDWDKTAHGQDNQVLIPTRLRCEERDRTRSFYSLP